MKIANTSVDESKKVCLTYTHAFGDDIFSIAGRYHIEKEERIVHNGKEVLYIIGQAIVDSSCCGSGGCRYAVVPGFIVSWRSGINKEGIPTSVIESIKDEKTKKEISERIRDRERVSQVQFW